MTNSPPTETEFSAGGADVIEALQSPSDMPTTLLPTISSLPILLSLPDLDAPPPEADQTVDIPSAEPEPTEEQEVQQAETSETSSLEGGDAPSTVNDEQGATEQDVDEQGATEQDESLDATEAAEPQAKEAPAAESDAKDANESDSAPAPKTRGRGSRRHQHRRQESWVDWRKQGWQLGTGLLLIGLVAVAIATIYSGGGEGDSQDGPSTAQEAVPDLKIDLGDSLEPNEFAGHHDFAADFAAAADGQENAREFPVDAGAEFTEFDTLGPTKAAQAQLGPPIANDHSNSFDPGAAPWEVERPSPVEQIGHAHSAPQTSYPETDPATFKNTWEQPERGPVEQQYPNRGQFQAQQPGRQPGVANRPNEIQRPPFQNRSRR